MARPRAGFRDDFKRFFLRGLGILLPSILTLWILVQASLFVFVHVAAPINRGIRWAVIQVIPQVPDSYQPKWFVVRDSEIEGQLARYEQERGVLADGSPEELRVRARLRQEIRAQKFEEHWESHWYLSGTGLVVAILLIYLAGLLLGGFLGRKVYHYFERIISRVPGFKQVYPHVKQIVDLVMGERQVAFKRVVFVEYPRKGIYTLGFVTAPGMAAVARVAGEPCLTVFIPSTPTPFTGFTITVKESEAFDCSLPVDEAVRFVLTGGVLLPDRERTLPGVNPAEPLPQAPPPAPTP